MQTFLPYPSFAQSAHCLDNRRLGKQRIEAFQILHALTEEHYGWKNHPAVIMWTGARRALVDYNIEICKEWLARGFVDTVAEKLRIYRIAHNDFEGEETAEWLGNEKFHASHRSNLLRKNPSHYKQFGWMEKDDLPYFWPGRIP